MMMYPTVAKPTEPTCTLNGLLSALAHGRIHGDRAGSLSFMDNATFLAPDQGPTGAANPLYTAVPPLVELDPTSLLGQSKEIVNFRNPVGTVAYTHHLRGLDYIKALSAQMAKWWIEYCTLYELAKAEQNSIETAEVARLGTDRTTRPMEGAVAAFVMATGELTGGEISYPAYQPVDVDVVYSMVTNLLEPLLTSLDHIGFSLAQEQASESIGIGTLPAPASAHTAFISAATFDALFSSPWKRMLRNTRAREMLRVPFQSRLDVALSAAAYDDDSMIGIAEGSDFTELPGPQVGNVGHMQTIFQTADQAPNLSDALYAMGRTPVWTDQLYTTGELVNALFVTGEVNYENASALSVLLNHLNESPSGWIVEPGVAGTGALGTYNQLEPASVNYITGMVDQNFDSVGGAMNPENQGQVTHHLPNGLLYMGDCAAATATDWITFLRWFEFAIPVELRALLEMTGRTKISLPNSKSATIASTDSLLGDMVSSSIRDGYLADISLAFNVHRYAREEHEGPLLGATLTSPATGNFEVTPVILPGANGWTRDDTSVGITLTTHLGETIVVDNPSCRFTGEMSAGRLATWAIAAVNDGIAWGDGDVADVVGENLLSLPAFRQGDIMGSPADFETRMNLTGALIDQNNLPQLYAATGSINRDAELAAAWENWHPTRGFKRGLACIMPSATQRSGISVERSRLNKSAGFTTITHPNGDVRSYWALQDDGHGFNESDGAMTPCLTHFWDPCRSQITGDSWYRWAGHFFADVLVHPYCPQPVAVTTSAMTLPDVNTRTLFPGENDVHASYVYPDSAQQGIGADGLTPCVSVEAWSVVDGRVENDDGSVCGNIVLGCSDHNPAMITGATQLAHYGHPAINIVPGASFVDATAVIGGDITVLPAFDCNISIKNGCQGHVINESGFLGLNATSGESGASIVPAVGLLGQSNLPLRWEGRLDVPVGDTVGYVGVAAVGGVGIVSEANPMAAFITRPFSWLMGVYNGFSPLYSTSGVQGIIQGNGPIPYMSVVTGRVGLTVANNLGAATGNRFHPQAKAPEPGLNVVENPWMRKRIGLSTAETKHRIAFKELNPWVRADGEDGIVHGRYEPADVKEFMKDYSRGVLDFGRTLQQGLSNSLFLEIQQIN